jgi:magnesium-transporting ATPase (P-type)
LGFSWLGENDPYRVRRKMDVSVVQPTGTKAPVPAGLSSAEAARRLLEYGPNAVVEERVHPVAQVVRHFWAPVPWMLKATIAMQIAIGERLEALMIATLLILNVALGIFQENRAGAVLALLKQHLALKARVRRDGEWVEALAAETSTVKKTPQPKPECLPIAIPLAELAEPVILERDV